MTFPPVRLPMILLIAGVLAACGRSEPVPPVAATEPVVAEVARRWKSFIERYGYAAPPAG